MRGSFCSARQSRMGRVAGGQRAAGAIVTLVVLSAFVVVLAPAASARSAAGASVHSTSALWHAVGSKLPAVRGARPAEIRPSHFRAYTLNRAGMRSALATAPRERTAAARRHPNIKTFNGQGLDDPTATIRLDQTPLGFHASIRGSRGSWYIDPYYHLDQSVYVSYFGRALKNRHGTFVEREVRGLRTASRQAGRLAVSLGRSGAQSVTAGPSVGSVLRTYRLALTSDPSYATFFGGPAFVTAAKVTLMNRVDQIYEDETSIRMILINDNDLLNLDTPALATDPNGPCGSAGCFTPAQLSTCGGGTLSRNRIVIGQIVGASNYDIGHVALGVNGGGVASLGVVGGNAKAQGCTGLPQPDGDFYAVDYVAHEMGHEFAGNHTFNGNQLNCSGGNRNGATSVEPGSGSSIMAYAGICRQDDLQPHSDPYWSQRSFEEITNYTSSTRRAINEVQTASLRDFDATDSFTINYNGTDSPAIVNGTNYSPAAIQAALQGPGEVQQVSLPGYDTNGDSYTLNYGGSDTVSITRGQNDTAAGVQAAIQGGNEQQQVTLNGFSGATNSFQVQIGGNGSAVLGTAGCPSPTRTSPPR
jgi:Metallo-peptidase family M12B Reprolysin-like